MTRIEIVTRLVAAWISDRSIHALSNDEFDSTSPGARRVLVRNAGRIADEILAQNPQAPRCT